MKTSDSAVMVVFMIMASLFAYVSLYVAIMENHGLFIITALFISVITSYFWVMFVKMVARQKKELDEMLKKGDTDA